MKKLMCVLVLLIASVACAAEKEQIAVGAKAPEFDLVNAVDGKSVAMKADDGVLKVVIFSCNQCPYAKAFEPRIIEVAKSFQPKGVRFYVIDPNDDTKYPEETMANMKARAVEKGYPFPYLKDGDSAIARAYGARVTPHVFVVDGSGTVRYRGYVDDSAKPAERQTTGLTDALSALLNGREVANADTRAFGCTIKWKT
ncbi:MAG TPA: thioredoxin family protein [Thermoanaerobaculia bacterium]|nr:thioredoxin family protein [Thermoanaerobaculia bacterium]